MERDSVQAFCLFFPDFFSSSQTGKYSWDLTYSLDTKNTIRGSNGEFSCKLECVADFENVYSSRVFPYSMIM